MAKPQIAVRTSRTFSPSSIVSGSFRHFDSSVFAAAWPTARSALDEAIGLRTRLDATPPYPRRLRRDIRHRPRALLDEDPELVFFPRSRPCRSASRSAMRLGHAGHRAIRAGRSPNAACFGRVQARFSDLRSPSAARQRRRGELTRRAVPFRGVRRFAATPGERRGIEGFHRLPITLAPPTGGAKMQSGRSCGLLKLSC